MTNATSDVQFKPLLFGAALGLGILFLLDPHHGDSRRETLKRNCRGVGQRCQSTWLAMLERWGLGVFRKTADFRAEIRAHAPAYLQ